MKKIINKLTFFLFIAGSVVMSSCTTSDLDPTLAQQKESANAFETVSDMQGVLKGMYNRFTSSEYYGRDYLVTNEVRTPNTWSNANSGRFATQASFAYMPNNGFIWDNAYGVIAVANILIGVDITTLEGDKDLAKHIQGQAYAARALAHFDLLKTYGQQYTGGNLGIPYITEFKGENETPARPTVDENVAAILADLETAFDMMSNDYFDQSKEFMSKYTAPALASRVGIQFGLWDVARDNAKLVMDSGLYSIVPAENFVQSFLDDGGPNSIFELAFSDVDNPGSNSLEQIYRGPSYGDISVTPNAFNLLYESSDDVRTEILGTEVVKGVTRLRNMGKFAERASNVIVIRYEEVVLNYGEALMNLNEGDPLKWLNMIPENRNANTYTEASTANFLEERREEFLFEGLYYWDLLRLGLPIPKIDPEQNILETVPFGDYRLAYPIPFDELDANSNIEQNRGYPG